MTFTVSITCSYSYFELSIKIEIRVDHFIYNVSFYVKMIFVKTGFVLQK